MVRPLYPIVISFLILSAVIAVANLPDQVTLARATGQPAANDAGSGQDAGDTPLQALLILSSTRTYIGNLSPAGTDHDWYRHAVNEAFCSKAESTMSTAGRITIAADALQNSAASRSVVAQTSIALALAAPAGRIPFLGIEPGLSITQSTGGPESPGRYTFKFQSFSLADLDPEAKGEVPEAGATSATAVAIPGSCFAGRLSGASDVADRYFVDVAEARVVTLSLAVASGASDTQLAFVSPSGVVAATITSGRSADVYASELGRWNLVVTRPSTATNANAALSAMNLLQAPQASIDVIDLETAYLIGVTDGPDPCRPSC